MGDNFCCFALPFLGGVRLDFLLFAAGLTLLVVFVLVALAVLALLVFVVLVAFVLAALIVRAVLVVLVVLVGAGWAGASRG